MKLLAALLMVTAYATLPMRTWSQVVRVNSAVVEMETKLLSLELPANVTDRNKVMNAMDAFARDRGFDSADGSTSPLRNIQRIYIGPHSTSVVLSFFPEHTFIGLSKRPGDNDPHQDIVQALNATFGALGFKLWIEPPE